MRYYEPRFLQAWLAQHDVDVAFIARSEGTETAYEERVETGPEGGEMPTWVPVERTIPGETVFLADIPPAVRDVLEMDATVDVYMDSPTAGDVTVEFTVPGATGDAEIRVYDDEYAFISSVTDTFDDEGVVGTVLQQPERGVYYVVLWRDDLPPLHVRVEV